MQTKKAERIRFIFNEPALLIDSTLIISDLHIGTEQELAKNSPSFAGSTERMLSHLLKVAKKSNPEKLILLGDILHAPIPNPDSDSSFALMDFFAKLNSEIKTEIIPGNLDSGIGILEKIGVKIHPASGIIADGVALSHGHLQFPDSFFGCGKIICPQEHFFGKHAPSWIISKIAPGKAGPGSAGAKPAPELILVPQFNPLIPLLPVSRGETAQSPMLGKNLYKLDDAYHYSLQGQALGNAPAARVGRWENARAEGRG